MFPFTFLPVIALGHACWAQSQARVLNSCSFPVYIRSVQGDDPPVNILSPGEMYAEQYRYLSAYNPAVGYNTSVGVSIKIARGLDISPDMDQQQRVDSFDKSGAVTQFEYTYDPFVKPGMPDLYYDISDIDDRPTRQFCQWGLSLQPDSPSCEAVSCPAQCGSNCAAVYNVWNDDEATHACGSEIGMTLMLCKALA